MQQVSQTPQLMLKQITQKEVFRQVTTKFRMSHRVRKCQTLCSGYLQEIRHHVNVANGFMTVPPADNPDLDNYMDDIDDENDAKYLEEIKK